MSPVMLVLAAALGAILGSFANVVIFRVPRGDSIVSPGSRCPHCHTPIRAWDNIPLLSFVLLGGRCRHCGAQISARYPLVEALMAVLAVAAWAAFPPVPPSPVSQVRFLSALIFLLLLVIITFIDLDRRLILNRITYPGIIIGLVFAAAQRHAMPAVLSAVGGAGLIAAIVILSRGGMGEGDIKLAALMGAFLGWPGVAIGLFSGFIAGGLVAIVLLALRLRGRKDAIPFGPALAVGAMVALFWGDAIWQWYTRGWFQ